MSRMVIPRDRTYAPIRMCVTLITGTQICELADLPVSTHWKGSRRHWDEMFVIGCVGSCHFVKFRCRRWRKVHQYADMFSACLPYPDNDCLCFVAFNYGLVPWNDNVVILMTFVVTECSGSCHSASDVTGWCHLTTSGAGSDKDGIKWQHFRVSIHVICIHIFHGYFTDRGQSQIAPVKQHRMLWVQGSHEFPKSIQNKTKHKTTLALFPGM